MRRLAMMAVAFLAAATACFADEVPYMYMECFEGSTQYAVREIACIRYTKDTMTVVYKDGTSQTMELENVGPITFEIKHVDDVVDNIKNATADGKTEVYDINGRRIKGSVESLPAGVYIIRRNGVTSKIVR